MSQATVSRVINDFAQVSPEVRERVKAAMAELGYVPNAAARTLVTRKTKMLGLVVSNITNQFYPQIIASINQRALEAGYSVMLGSADESTDRQASLLDLLGQQRVDGAILTSAFLGGEPQIQPLIERSMPLVLANRANESLEVDSVSLDNREGARVATLHLINGNRERIAYVGGRTDTATDRDKLAGYRAGLQEAGIAVIPELERHGEYTHAMGYRAIQDLVALGHPFDGVLAADDTIALGCLDALVDAGLRVPEDVGLVGFDDISTASLRRISLSTVDSKAGEMGALATDLLLDRVEGRYDGPPRRMVLPAFLVVRESSSQRRRVSPAADQPLPAADPVAGGAG